MPEGVRPHANNLGLHVAIDRAIFHAYEQGAIAGASILVGGPTFREAAAEAVRLQMPTWLHLALVDARPVSPPGEIRSLVGTDGRFPPSLAAVLARALSGQLNPDQVRLEVRRQMERLADFGLADSRGMRIDGHQHLHLLPVVKNALFDLTAEWHVRAIRQPRLSKPERDRASLRSWLFRVVEILGDRVGRGARARGIEVVPCWGAMSSPGI